MAIQLKPLSQQVVFITGASSGIGRVTARRAAALGAKVALVARNGEALRVVVDEITKEGGQAIHAVADVADMEQLRAAADAAVSAFGRIDTWVNNAGVGLFTDITENNVDDDKKLFETNFWGIVNGSRLAVGYLRDGGALINLGSEVSDIATPTQGMYAASKHAVMGFTDAFRMEVIKSELPISVTLIKPAAIDTPFAKHARNTTDKATTLPPPVYSPELVADQILHAAENPVRDLYVGGGGRAMALLAEHFPTLSDWVISKMMPKQELKEDEPADHSNEALHGVGGGAYEERGGLQGERMVREKSAYGLMSRHPVAVTFGVAAVSAAAAYLLLREPEPTRTEQWRKAARDRAASLGDTARGYVKQALSEAQRYAQDARSRASDYADSARDYAHDAGETAKDYANDYAGRFRKSANRAADHTQARAEDAVDRLRDVADEYLAQPAEQLISSIRKGIAKILG